MSSRLIVVATALASLASQPAAQQPAFRYAVDLVAVYSDPFGKPLVDLQHDHALAAKLLDKIAGRYSPPQGKFGLSLSEILDITAGDTAELARVVARECDPTDRLCGQTLKGEAQIRAAIIEAQSRQSL